MNEEERTELIHSVIPCQSRSSLEQSSVLLFQTMDQDEAVFMERYDDEQSASKAIATLTESVVEMASKLTGSVRGFSTSHVRGERCGGQSERHDAPHGE